MRRRGLAATGAAIGAFALAPAAAHAENFEVNTLSDSHAADGCDPDPGDCTLRDALTDAGANSEPDLITFQAGLTGDLDLAQGELGTNSSVVDDITIQGPGAAKLTINASPDSRVLNLLPPDVDPGQGSAGAGTSLAISGLTLSGGEPISNGGGAIAVGKYASLDLQDTTISGNTAPTGNGGGISIGKYGALNLDHSTITGNEATTGRGGAIGPSPFGISGPGGPKYSGAAITATDSTISNNNAANGGGIDSLGTLTIENSTLSENHATTGTGGALRFTPKYGPLNVTDSVISGNTAHTIGAGIFYAPYTPGGGTGAATVDNQITNTTIDGNTAASRGGGIYSSGVGYEAGSFTVDHSTISNNGATYTTSYGGGIDLEGTVNGRFAIVDSTVSGNDTGVGAGVSIGAQVGPSGSIAADNSTIAGNTSTYEGGGMWVDQYGTAPGPYPSPPVHVNSTIVGDNTASGTPDDLGRNDLATSGGFQLSFSLVEAPTDAIDTQADSITGQDPVLAGLTNNGGPTETMLPATSSPAIDAGDNPLSLLTDQRGQPRTVDGPPSNVADGTDIGAVERSEVPPSPAPPASQPPAAKKPRCKKKHKKKHKRSAESSKQKHKKHKKCKKKHKKKRH